jgi:hypothetical protein
VEVCPTCQRAASDDGDRCPLCALPPGTDDDAPAAPRASPSARLARRDVLVIAAAIIGSGAISLAALRSGGSPPPPPLPVPAEARSLAAPESRSATASSWVENAEAWVGGGRKGIALELAAGHEIPIWMRTVRPLLVVRCVDTRAEVFVFTDSAAAMEPRTDDHTVRLAFDGGVERTERWPDSSSHDALFAPDGGRLIEELGRARTMTFGFTPHNAAPVVAHFDVAGLRDRLTPAQRHCQP